MQSNTETRHFPCCAESRKFIRLKRFDGLTRQTRCFLLFLRFPVSPVSLLYLSVTSWFCVFPLPISHSMSFISRNQSCIRQCNRIGKFLCWNGRSHRRQTNEDERLNATSLQENTLENATVPAGENKIYPAQNALRSPRPMLSADSTHGRSALLRRRTLFSDSAGAGETAVCSSVAAT